MPDQLKIFSGNANLKLANDICAVLGIRLGLAQVAQFEDGETLVRINENIRGEDIFVIQPTHSPAVNLMELLVLVDACKRASARRVTAVVPYFGYARQDRKDQPRVSITAKLVSNLITVAGADRVLTMDLHSSQIQGFFDIPFDHLFAAPVLAEEFHRRQIPDLTVVAPDIGSVKMARAYAKRLGADLALVDKRRPKADSVEVMNVIGEVRGRNVVMFDDMVTTASTLIEASNALRESGAKEVYAGVTHAVLCGEAEGRIARSAIKEVVVTDTVPHDPKKLPAKIQVRSVAPLLAEAIRRIHKEESLSSLFMEARPNAPAAVLESPER
ncbi:MAG TPA: ribose-phosphate pyrophosphokinase [Candidatus Saccharimonadales bacterium]|nr:ribose-phosphate pyrophosphokinase [Candidatus Saccharimonadales bacterium]